jgi:hypothetical protein
MTPQEKFFAALNIAFRPTTIEADIVAAVRGAYRVLGGKTTYKFRHKALDR